MIESKGGEAIARGCDVRPQRWVHSWAARVMGSNGSRIGFGTATG
jgi:hypothetical protein